mmetsp:Transcript_62742/g.183514  ORF Transcript_62742/g.183514 Transcript_62742/m.183514 type:complete len:96 (+) Transcript_62742:113-400(+)
MAAAAAAPEESPPSTPAVGRSTSKHSIIKGNSGRETRVDSFGQAIEKGGKGHRCTFADERDPRAPVEEKFEIVSYKGAGGPNTYDSQPGCGCSLM